MHADAPFGAKNPEEHAMHEVNPEVEYVPGLHVVGTAVVDEQD